MQKLKAILLGSFAQRLYWNFANGLVALAIVYVSGIDIWWSPLAFAFLNGITKEISNKISTDPQ